MRSDRGDRARVLALWILIPAFVGAIALSPAGAGRETTKDDLAQAVATMRNLDPAALSKALSDEELEEKARELDRAWGVLQRAGERGAAALEYELRRLEESGEKDDLFKLGASAVLWKIGGLDEAGAIAGIWSGDVDLSLNYNYVFFTAFEAARTRDPRAVPMLKAVLRDRRGEVYVPQHALTVAWPLSHSFLWGLMGSSGVDPLVKILDEAEDENVLASAIIQLGDACALEALGRIRALAKRRKGIVRSTAIKVLGTFGHPEDYEFLIRGLKDEDPDVVFASAFALYEYEDLRAVPHLVPLLATGDEELARETISCLGHLATREGIDALRTCASKHPSENVRGMCSEAIRGLLPSAGVTESDYDAMGRDDREIVCRTLRRQEEDKYTLKRQDRTLSRKEFLKAAAKWEEANRIRGGKYEWVEDRHVLSAATPDDIPVLLDVIASCYRRLSDECLYEIHTLREIVNRLGRRRYRKEAGLCGRVSPLPG